MDREGAFTSRRGPGLRPPKGYGRSGRTARYGPQAGEGSVAGRGRIRQDGMPTRPTLPTAKIGGNGDDGHCQAESNGEPDLPSSADPVEGLKRQRQRQRNEENEEGENDLYS